jgi:hypothetical protein
MMRLKQVAGQLSPEDIFGINAQLSNSFNIGRI